MKPTIGHWQQTVFLDIFRKKWSKYVRTNCSYGFKKEKVKVFLGNGTRNK